MPAKMRQRTVPRITLTRAEAAEALGVSTEHFARYIQPEVRLIRSGAKVLVPVAELQAWADREAQAVL